MQTITVRLCKSCTHNNTGLNDIEPFLDGVLRSLQTQRSDYNWYIERTGCMRVCPDKQISMTVSSSRNVADVRLTLSKEATIESVVKEVLSFFPPRQETR